MARNVEIKARVENIVELEKKVIPLATQGPEELIQDDTFFNCKEGRLKLREFASGYGQLVFYKRNDKYGPKESFYLISETTSPQTLREVLSTAYGVIGRVKKKRLLYMVGRTRVHLDVVEDLGQFMELEVVLDESETTEVGIAEAHNLMSELGIDNSQLIEGAYFDLLNQHQ